MNYAAPFIDGYNAVTGAIVAVLSYILGEHWILFAAFLLLNVGAIRISIRAAWREKRIQ